MRKDRILIEKSLIPYTFDILLADELFTITVDYNQRNDFFTVALEKDGEMICEGEPLIYGFPLFADFYQAGKLPSLDIIPLDASGENTAVTFQNLGETVFLTVENAGEEE